MALRRRVPRQTTGWTGKCSFGDQPSSHDCRVLDISVIGAGIEVFAAVPDPLGSRLTVEVNTPAGASVSVRLVGVIKNVGPGHDGGTRLGIEFADLSETERSLLTLLAEMKMVW